MPKFTYMYNIPYIFDPMIKVFTYNYESLELPSVKNQEIIKVTYQVVYLVPGTVGKYNNS